MKKKIAILMGGLSREREISFLSGKACCRALEKKGYAVKTIDAKGYFVEQLIKAKPTKVFNALHGKFGEDGFVQSVLEHLKIPYTHSGALPSSLAMDKELSRILFKKAGISVPKYIILERHYEGNIRKKLRLKKIRFPIVLKPVNEGSSIGVYICKNFVDFFKFYKRLQEYKKIMVEEYIPGREIQVAVMGKKALGAIELMPKRQFYDYKAKYSKNAKTKHLMPAPLSSKKYKEVLALAKKAHDVLRCKGVTRSDFRFNKNKFYLLELNTQPGMTKLSLVPEIALYKGIKFEDLVDWMINDASYKR